MAEASSTEYAVTYSVDEIVLDLDTTSGSVTITNTANDDPNDGSDDDADNTTGNSSDTASSTEFTDFTEFTGGTEEPKSPGYVPGGNSK